ncbi:MAG: hypothetical protein P8X96_20730 [Desulfobacteraceae bacterium]
MVRVFHVACMRVKKVKGNPIEAHRSTRVKLPAFLSSFFESTAAMLILLAIWRRVEHIKNMETTNNGYAEK